MRPRPLAAALLTTLALGVLGACSALEDDRSGGDAPSPAPTTTTTTTAPATPAEAEVLDPGRAPRTLVELAWSEGQEFEVTLTTDLAIDQQGEDGPQRLDSPPIDHVLRYEVGASDAAGTELTVTLVRATARAGDPIRSEEEVAELQARLDPLAGLTGTARVDAQGRSTEVAFEVPDEVPEAAAAQIEALSEQLPTLGPVLPEVPVGSGARWRTEARTLLGGAEVRTTSTFTITDVDADRLAYTVEITSTAPPQELAPAGLDEGTTVELLGWELRGSGSGTLGLTTPGFELRTRLTGEQRLSVTGPDGTQELTQQVALAQAARPGAG